MINRYVVKYTDCADHELTWCHKTATIKANSEKEAGEIVRRIYPFTHILAAYMDVS